MPARLRRDIRDSLLPHWHDELEIAWIFQGHNIHCISGHRYLSQPGTLVITNCESVHKIIPVEEELSEGPRRSIILLVSRDFLTRFIPEYPGKIRFCSILEDAPKEIKDLLIRLAAYSKEDAGKPYAHPARRGSCWSFCFCSVLARGNLPKFYLACGTEDVLLGVNRSFRDVLREGGADVTYVEESGGHDWDFWNRQIQEALDWLPLDAAKQGISSGHVTGNQKLHTSAFTPGAPAPGGIFILFPHMLQW